LMPREKSLRRSSMSSMKDLRSNSTKREPAGRAVSMVNTTELKKRESVKRSPLKSSSNPSNQDWTTTSKPNVRSAKKRLKSWFASKMLRSSKSRTKRELRESSGSSSTRSR
jgi:hypothetical protein